jgi:sugar diacid utilization regulator
VLSSTGPLSGQLLSRAQRLGHDLSVAHVAIVATLTGSTEVAGRLGWQRALAVVTELASAYRPKPLVAMHGGTLVTLWPEGTDSSAPPGVMVQRAMAQVSQQTTATAAVSASHTVNFGEAYRIAKGALDIALQAGRAGTTITLDDLGIVGLLLQLNDPAKLMAFAARTLQPIIDYDAGHRTELMTTLRSYFACKQDRQATAKMLVIHPNTVAQRLRRIEHLCGVDLADPAITTQVSSALTVHDVATRH